MLVETFASIAALAWWGKSASDCIAMTVPPPRERAWLRKAPKSPETKLWNSSRTAILLMPGCEESIGQTGERVAEQHAVQIGREQLVLVGAEQLRRGAGRRRVVVLDRGHQRDRFRPLAVGLPGELAPGPLAAAVDVAVGGLVID